MTNTQEKKALDGAFGDIQKSFTKLYGFAPSKNQIIPLEASYDTISDVYWCESLGFRVGTVGYSYRMGHPVTKNDAYDA